MIILKKLVRPLLLLAIGINFIAADAFAVGFSIGADELLYTADQMLNTYGIGMDGSFATLRRDSSTFYFWETDFESNTPNTRWYGPPNAPFQTNVWHKTQDQMWNAQGFQGQFWLYNIYKIDSTGRLLGFVHREQGSPSPFAIGMGYSSDNGDTWTFLGDIIRPQNNNQNAAGVPYLVVGNYFYVYYAETPLSGPWRIGVARALVSDVINAAVNNLTTVPWTKYDNGVWDQDGLTGLGSGVLDQSYDLHSDAAYDTALGQYVLTAPGAANGTYQLYLFLSSDGVNWGNKTVVDSIPLVTGGYICQECYSTIVDAAGSDDSHIIDGDFYIIYPRKNSLVYNNNELHRRLVTVTGGGVVSTTPAAPQGLRAT